MGNAVKDVELKLVSELIKNSRRSDRELARVLGLSQPTVGRMIKKREKAGIIQGYTIIPDMTKLGIEIVAITLVALEHQIDPEERMRKSREFVENHPNLIFVSSGRGTNSDRVAISVHKSYSDYAKFMREVKAEVPEYHVADTFLLSYRSDIILRPLSFKTLADYLKKEKS